MLLSVINFEELLKGIIIKFPTILLIGLLIKKLNQPYFFAYIIAEILLGQYGFKVFSNAETIAVIVGIPG
jgi:Kef-type K+ transport system membrane component KefB